MEQPIKTVARKLRRKGLSYSEISKKLNLKVPKSTLNYWCKDVLLDEVAIRRLRDKARLELKKAQTSSVLAKKLRREEMLNEKLVRNSILAKHLLDPEIKKISLGLLYLAEGTKRRTGCLTFGNSNPEIISLFLMLFRTTFTLDESKFRITLQGRSDQDTHVLETYWSKITSIPMLQFYSARIDKRSIGQVSLKKEYKGVCRIDYISADMLYEVTSIGTVLLRGS